MIFHKSHKPRLFSIWPMILLIGIWNNYVYGADMQKSIMNALYKQTGTEEYVNTVAKDLDKKYVPDSIRTNGVVVLMLLQCSVTRQIAWKWSF